MNAWSKLFANFQWRNRPSTETPLGRSKLQLLNDAIDGIDDRVLELDEDKADTTYVNTALNGKVDKVTGKGLSTNDYTNQEKNKLAGITVGANHTAISNTLEEGDDIAIITIDGTQTRIKAPLVEVDDTPSHTSTNPLENRAIYEMIQSILPEKTATGNPISIADASGLSAKSCEVTMNPIQEGTGDPSPSNIRPISGRDSVDVVVTGTNQWDEEWEVGYIDSHGENTASAINIRSKNFIPIVPNTRYYLKSGYTTIVYCPIFFYDENKVFLSSNLQQVWNTVITTPSNSKYMRFYMNSAYGTTYNNDISINYPPTDTEYHAYNGQTKTITFPSTIYGGTDEVVGGVGSEKYGYIASYNEETLPGYWISDRDVYAEGTTPSTGAEVCYELATPIPFSTTPTPIPLNKGNNTVSSDADDLELKYSVDLSSLISGE